MHQLTKTRLCRGRKRGPAQYERSSVRHAHASARKTSVRPCKLFSRLPCPDGHLEPQNASMASLWTQKQPESNCEKVRTARRSLWLRRTAGAERRGTNSQSEEAEYPQI